MAIIPKTDKAGNIISYKFMCCVGRDAQYKQVWRTKTVKKPEGFTPKKLEKEVQRLYDEWEAAQKEDFTKTHSKEDKSRTTFEKFVRDHWLPDHVHDGDHTPGSITFYESMAADLLAYFGSKIRLSQIDAEKVKRYLKYMRTEAVSKRGKPYSATTIQHHFGTLRNILNYAARFHYVQANPCNDLTQREKPHRDKKEVDFLVKEDALRFLKCLEDEPLYWRCFGNLLIYGGLRRGEAIGLTWGDIDSEKIKIKRSISQDKNSETKRHIGKTKTKEWRTVYISKPLYALLLQFKHEQEEIYGALLPSAFVFHADTDPYTPIYPSAPTKWQSRFVEKHGLPPVSPHDLRHTAASLALEAGADLKEVQQLMGHKDAATTMSFYAGLSEERKKRTTEKIAELLAETEKK